MLTSEQVDLLKEKLRPHVRAILARDLAQIPDSLADFSYHQGRARGVERDDLARMFTTLLKPALLADAADVLFTAIPDAPSADLTEHVGAQLNFLTAGLEGLPLPETEEIDLVSSRADKGFADKLRAHEKALVAKMVAQNPDALLASAMMQKFLLDIVPPLSAVLMEEAKDKDEKVKDKIEACASLLSFGFKNVAPNMANGPLAYLALIHESKIAKGQKQEGDRLSAADYADLSVFLQKAGIFSHRSIHCPFTRAYHAANDEVFLRHGTDHIESTRDHARLHAVYLSIKGMNTDGWENFRKDIRIKIGSALCFLRSEYDDRLELEARFADPNKRVFMPDWLRHFRI